MEKRTSLENILETLIKDMKKHDFLAYFRKISLLHICEESVTFGVQSLFMKENLEHKFYDIVLQATKKVYPSVQTISFQVDDTIDNPLNTAVIECTDFYKTAGKEKPVKENGFEIQPNKTQRYTLDNFIVWPSNQLPYSACEAVVRNPGTSYNPLYIYGDVGLWKTHLLQGTGHAIEKKYKDKKVKYLTADKFMTDYVTAIKKKWVEALRRKYIDADVIIIDDVQFLSKKEQTQNELYNIFNILYDSQKQIIISGDRSPKELTEIEPRLQSRFEWGIIVDISKPDFETRLAILQEKARSREFLIHKDVAEFIAANVTNSVRELEGFLNQLIAEYELDQSSPTLEKVARKLKKLNFTSDMLGEIKTPRMTTIKSYEDIITAVSNHFGIEKEGILWENRKKEFMIPRQVAMYLLKTKLHYTYERIGNIFSGRNHAAVLYSCNKLDSLLKKDKNLLYEINILRDGIGI